MVCDCGALVALAVRGRGGRGGLELTHLWLVADEWVRSDVSLDDTTVRLGGVAGVAGAKFRRRRRPSRRQRPRHLRPLAVAFDRVGLRVSTWSLTRWRKWWREARLLPPIAPGPLRPRHRQVMPHEQPRPRAAVSRTPERPRRPLNLEPLEPELSFRAESKFIGVGAEQTSNKDSLTRQPIDSGLNPRFAFFHDLGDYGSPESGFKAEGLAGLQ